jgi:hypothetical protein
VEYPGSDPVWGADLDCRVHLWVGTGGLLDGDAVTIKHDDDDSTRSAETTVIPADVHASANEPTRKVLTIERATWRRGGESGYKAHGSTNLLNEFGFMCCMGFDALACGIPKQALLNANYPSSLVIRGRVDSESEYARTRTRRDSQSLLIDSQAAARAVKANDADDITEAEREARVRDALIALGWDDVVFV